MSRPDVLRGRAPLVLPALDPATTLVVRADVAAYPPWAGPGREACPPLELRRPGAQVPAPDEPDAALLGIALELGVTDVVVCGHTGCPTVRDALREGRTPWPALEHALCLLRRFYERRGLDERGRLEVLVQENVLVQLEALRDHPALRLAVTLGRVRLHGWVHEPGVGLWAYHPGQEQFVRLEAPWRAPPERARRTARWLRS